MAFQLTLSQADLPASDALKRKTVLSFDGASATIGGESADCPLPGVSGIIATLALNAEGTAVLSAASALCLNHQALSAGSVQPIHSGDTITAGGWAVQFHVCLPPASQSWQSGFLAVAARTTIALLLVIVVALMFGLKDIMRQSERWSRFAAREHLSRILETERLHVKKLEKKGGLSPLNALLLEQIRLDLDERARHVRTYEDQMSFSQHKDMIEGIQKLSDLLSAIEGGKDYPSLPSPSLDQAVPPIINHH